MLTVEQIKARKAALEEAEMYKIKKIWHRVHLRSENLNNLFGAIGIVCGTLSSQLSEHEDILLFTGLAAAISTALVAFFNLRSRSVTFINAWRILDEATTNFVTDENTTLDQVGEAKNRAEDYIRDSLHKG